jgi:hypothetical protein
VGVEKAEITSHQPVTRLVTKICSSIVTEAIIIIEFVFLFLVAKEV